MIRNPRQDFSGVSVLCRRKFLGVMTVGCFALWETRMCPADERPGVSAEVERCVKDGFKFLEKQQNREGSFVAEGQAAVSVAARALLAYLAAGHIPDVGRYGLTVHRAVDFLLGQQGAQGLYGSPLLGIRAHVVATTALSQAFGVETNSERRARIHGSLGNAVGVILGRQTSAKSQSQSGGGWAGGSPDAQTATLPVSALSLLALKACAGIGFPLPQPVTARAIDFSLRCFDAASGGFARTPGQSADVRSTCAGVVSLFACDAAAANVPKISSSARYILAHAAEIAAGADPVGGLGPLAAMKLGNDVWTAVEEPTVARVLKSQEKDGSWPGSKPAGRPEVSRTAATASALSVLTMSYPLLPIYQR